MEQRPPLLTAFQRFCSNKQQRGEDSDSEEEEEEEEGGFQS